MVNDTWLLMNLYWKLDRREVTGQSPWRILAFVLGGVGFLVIAAASAAAGYFSSFLTRPDSPIPLSPGLIPGLILTFMLLSVVVTGLNQAVKSLFLSGDLDRLMVAPVHTRSIMVAKLLSRLPSNMLLLLLLGAPAFVAYGIGYGAGPVYYLVGAVLVLLAPLFGLAVGAIIAMLLVRWLPVNRLNELLAAAYAMFGIIIALLFQLPRLYVQDDPEEMMGSVSSGAIPSLVDAIERLPLPTIWAGKGLLALDAGQVDAAALLGIGAYVLMTLGLFALVLLTADGFYMTGWLKTQSAGGKRRGLETGGGVFSRGSLNLAIGWKDWLLRLRDPRQLVSLVGSGFIAIVVGALAIFRGSGSDTSLMALAEGGQLTTTGPLAVLTTGFSPGLLIASWALFVGYLFLSNTATYALALEGLALPMLKAAPIRAKDVWQAKLWSIFSPYVVIFVLVLVGSWFFVRYSLIWFPYAALVGIIMGFGLMACNVSTGFRYANLGWTDPRRMISSGGGIVSLLLWIAYSIPAGIIVILGYSLRALWPAWTIPFAVIALVLLGLYTWLWYVWMLRWAEKAWERLPV